MSSRPYQIGGAWALLLIMAAWDFPALWQVWTTDPRLSFAPVIACVAVVLAWRNNGHWQDSPNGRGFGAALVCVFGAMHIGAVWGDIACLKPIALLGVAGGLIACSWGVRRLKQSIGILGWLLFLVPWPTTVTASLQFWMQLVSSRWAALFCGMAGIEVRCEGVELFLAPHASGPAVHRVLIAQPCSGLISMLTLLAIGYLLALLTPLRLWARGLLLLAAVPCALFANGIRITLIVGMEAAGRHALAQWLHTHEQPVLVLLCSFVLLGLRTALLSWSLPGAVEPMLPGSEQAQGERLTGEGGAIRPSAGIFQLVNVFLLLVLLLGRWGAQVERSPISSGDFLRDVTLDYKGWRQTSVALPAADVAALQPDALLMRQWQNGQGESIELTVIAGHRKRTLHTPAFCLRGEGWEVIADNIIALKIPSQNASSQPMQTITATNMEMLRDGQHIFVTYFFTNGDYHTASLAQFQGRQLWRRIWGEANQTSLAALVRVAVSSPTGDARQANARTAAFARETLPAILERLRTARRGSASPNTELLVQRDVASESHFRKVLGK